MKLHGDRPRICDAVVHVRVTARVGEAYHGWHHLALQVLRPAYPARLGRATKHARANDALGVNRTEPGMGAGERTHGFHDLSNDGLRRGRHYRLLFSWRT